MLSSKKRDKNRRALVKKFEIKSLQAKVFSQDQSLKNIVRSKADTLDSLSSFIFFYPKTFKEISRNSSKSRVKNRCIETGRSHSVLRFCKLSRICLRNRASRGAIPGMSKASW